MDRLSLIMVLYLLTSVSVGAVDLTEAKAQAEQGDAWYQTELALMHHNGTGMPKDYAKAIEWYRKAARQEHIGAQKELNRLGKSW